MDGWMDGWMYMYIYMYVCVCVYTDIYVCVCVYTGIHEDDITISMITITRILIGTRRGARGVQGLQGLTRTCMHGAVQVAGAA